MEKRGLKASVDKNKMIVLGEEDESVCEVVVDLRQLEHVSKFKRLEFG